MQGKKPTQTVFPVNLPSGAYGFMQLPRSVGKTVQAIMDYEEAEARMSMYSRVDKIKPFRGMLAIGTYPKSDLVIYGEVSSVLKRSNGAAEVTINTGPGQQRPVHQHHIKPFYLQIGDIVVDKGAHIWYVYDLYMEREDGDPVIQFSNVNPKTNQSSGSYFNLPADVDLEKAGYTLIISEDARPPQW